MSDFTLDVTQGAEGATIRMAGTIDESVDLKLPGPLPPGVVRLDLGGVESINSLGVGRWLRFYSDLRSQAAQIVITNLSVALTLQASMISTFLEGAVVESFLVPYECENCGNAEERLFQRTADVPASTPCPKCQGTMELDSDPDAYLAFR